jgi:hypothetical protein
VVLAEGRALAAAIEPNPLLGEQHVSLEVAGRVETGGVMDWVVWVVVAAIVVLVGAAYLAGRRRARQVLAGRSMELGPVDGSPGGDVDASEGGP